MTTVLIEHDSERKIDYLTLNRPKQLNAINSQMVDELLKYFSDLETRDLLLNGPVLETRLVVIRGNGRAFCAGLDLQEGGFLESTGVEFFNFQRRLSHIMLLMRRVKQPIVCLTQGAVCGGGLAIALASDIRISTNDAKFNVAMAKIGLTGGDLGISYFLPRVVGPSMAAEMMMTGKFLHAKRAYELGMISSLCENVEELNRRGDEMAHLIVDTTPPLPLVMTKEVLKCSLNAPNLESMVAMEDRQQIISLKEPTFKEYVSKGFKKSNL